MAFALEQDAVFATFFFEDDDGDITTRRYQMQWNTDLATTVADVDTLATRLRAVTDAAINKYTIQLQYDEGSPESRAGENNEVAHVIVGLLENPPLGMSKTAVIEVPAPADAIRVAASGPNANYLDAASVELVALVDSFDVAGIAYLSHGQTRVEITGGYVHHKRSKRG